MTDDPRLEAVARAYCDERFGPSDSGILPPIAFSEAVLFCAMIRAFLGEDSDRKEVVQHKSETDLRAETKSKIAPAPANAQPVSVAEVEAATNVVRKKWGPMLADYWIVRAALEAAAKVRAGG